MEERPEAGEFAKVAALIRDIRIALLTTLDLEGHFHTRPIQTLKLEAERTLWFFTDWSSPKVGELQSDIRVSLGYASSETHSYVAICGTGRLFQDAAKARQLWSAEQFAFYPRGPEDARLALLCVTIEHAEYWIAPGRASYLVAAVQAAATGKPAQILGENRKVPPNG
jgi:general stress protein 26